MLSYEDGKRVADYTPSAQRLRRARLEPTAMVERLSEWRDRTEDGEFYAAVDLIKLTGYLRCSDAERVQLIDRILSTLDEVTSVRHFVKPASE